MQVRQGLFREFGTDPAGENESSYRSSRPAKRQNIPDRLRVACNHRRQILAAE